MNLNSATITDEERLWLSRLEEFHFGNRTPNHRNENNDVIDIAIDGLDYINDLPLKGTE